MEYKLCDECGAAPAAGFVTKIYENEVAKVALCVSCAARIQGLDGFKASYSEGFFMPSFVDLGAVARESECSSCGMGIAQFNESGYLGCPDCYREFKAYLAPVIKRIQGSVRHTGKVPKVMPAQGNAALERRRLKEELDRAVAEQRYEDAAKLRDRLNRL